MVRSRARRGAFPPGGPPQGPQQPLSQAESSPSGKSGVGWKIATGVCALLAVGALGWGFMQKNDASKAAEANAAALEQAQQEIAKDTAEEEQVKEALNKAQAAHEEVAKKLKTKGKELKTEAAKLQDLQAQYNQAAKEAAQKNATLKQELAASEAKTALATKCAQVMATGMQVIYDAETPDEVMNDVAKEMQKAADSCQGVVSFG